MRQYRIFISHPSHFLTDCEPHGDGLLAQEYIRRLGERGHEVHVAVPVMRLERAMPASVVLHSVDSWTSVSTANPSALNRLEYAVRVRGLLGRLQRTVKFDLIHQLNPVVLGMSALLFKRGLPVVLGPLPAPGALPLPDSVMRRLNRAFLHSQIRRAAMVLMPNAASLPLIPEDAVSRAKVRELHFGIDTERFQPIREDFEPESPNVLFLANLVPRKGGQVLLEAFEAVAARYPGWTLRFAGGGTYEAALKERAGRSDFSERIQFLGAIPREGVAEVLKTASIYCLPSSYEAFGMSVLEAMACGCPVIGTSVGGLRLLVQGSSPEVAPEDAVGLAGALDGLMGSAEKRRELRRLNRRTAVEEYSWDGVIDRLEELYGEVVRG